MLLLLHQFRLLSFIFTQFFFFVCNSQFDPDNRVFARDYVHQRRRRQVQAVPARDEISNVDGFFDGLPMAQGSRHRQNLSFLDRRQQKRRRVDQLEARLQAVSAQLDAAKVKLAKENAKADQLSSDSESDEEANQAQRAAPERNGASVEEEKLPPAENLNSNLNGNQDANNVLQPNLNALNLGVQRVGPNVIRNEESVDLVSDNEAAAPKQYGMLKTSRLRRNKNGVANPAMVKAGVDLVAQDASFQNFVKANSNAEMKE